MKEWLAENLGKLSQEFAPCSKCPLANTERETNLPGTAAVIDLVEDLMGLLFPGCHGLKALPHEQCHSHVLKTLEHLSLQLVEQVRQAFHYGCDEGSFEACDAKAEQTAKDFLLALPKIRNVIEEDIKAAYEGDPAAQSTMEVVMSYPGLFAVVIHRLAHQLYLSGVPLLPRIMSEHAHGKTGIDIHPGATIGPRFFIDHGTGVVIGETCIIGRNVKLYQGVTLGALSFVKDASTGMLVKGIKRHPNVEDNVVIYAGATILGGDTVIGHDSVIGGNVWLMQSVPPHSRVYNKPPAPDIVLRTP